MTAAELRKVAGEARKLADECTAGTAPPLIQYQLCRSSGGVERYCVMGLLGKRALNDAFMFYTLYGSSLQDVADVAVEANNNADDAGRHAAVVFPLLAFADACDVAAAVESGNG